MRVELGELACRGLELHVGKNLEAGVRIALAAYLETAGRGRGRVDAPCFDGEDSDQSSRRPLEVPVDASVEAALKAEARRQGISLSRLATHSVYLYLARLDLGIAAGR
jgi:hypothetical protein